MSNSGGNAGNRARVNTTREATKSVSTMISQIGHSITRTDVAILFYDKEEPKIYTEYDEHRGTTKLAPKKLSKLHK